MARTVIYGPGGFGREVLKHAVNPVFLADDGRGLIHGTEIIGFDGLEPDDEIVIAVSDAHTRRVMDTMCRGRRFGKLIAANCEIGQGVELGEGAILCSGVTLTADIKIGRHFHANLRAVVGHDVVIGDFCHLSCNVIVNGNVTLGDDVYIGTGAIIRNGIPGNPLCIGAGAVIGMGAVVTKDVPAGAVMVGNPARSLQPKPVVTDIAGGRAPFFRHRG